jgi:hypothetical protein
VPFEHVAQSLTAFIGEVGACHERCLVRWHLEQTADLVDGALDDRPRRGLPGSLAVLDVLDHRIDERGIRLEPLRKALDPFRRVRLLDARQVVGERLGTGHLVDALELVLLLLVRRQPDARHDGEHVERDRVSTSSPARPIASAPARRS